MDKKSLNSFSINANTIGDFSQGAESSTLDSFIQIASGIVSTPVLFKSSSAVLNGSSLNRFALNTTELVSGITGIGANTTQPNTQVSAGTILVNGAGINTEVVIASGAAALFITGVASSSTIATQSADSTVAVDGANNTTATQVQASSGVIPVTADSSETTASTTQVSSGTVAGATVYGQAANTVDTTTQSANGTVTAANLWNTSQGVAKGYAKFTPMQDGEPFLTEQVLTSSFTTVKPFTDGTAPYSSEKCNISVGSVFEFKANGYAPIKTKPNMLYTSRIEPEATAATSVFMFRAETGFSLVTPKSEAMPYIQSQAMSSELGYTFPWGVRNPSDEEIITLIMHARKQRHLTANSSGGIRQ